jgi:renalase
MLVQHRHLSVAVVGAGVAGAACAHTLSRAGLSVHLFDKSHGPGGRLATRCTEWVDQLGRAVKTPLDHGALGFTARSSGFGGFVAQAEQAGWLAKWTPTLAPRSLPLDSEQPWCVPVPDMPALCRNLVANEAASWAWQVEGLHKGPLGWQLQSPGRPFSELFDVVLLALPPVQAAPLLMPHRRDWAQRATLTLMQPCWTLMGIADAPGHDAQQALDWHLARPPEGPLAWVLRNDARPGRERVAGHAHWVLHARAGWSRRHLEQPAEWVRTQMQAALAEWLGQAVAWQHSVVHRWRYATPQAPSAMPVSECWWDAAQGLGVCGDFLGGAGVEGAWLSAQALAAALLASPTPAAAATGKAATTEAPAW